MSEEGYRRLQVYQLAHSLAIDIHRMTLSLPKHEMFEQGSQIRRSSKSVAAQIVEGYCLRKNKKEFVQYLNRSYASAHETIEHLDILSETGSLTNEVLYVDLRKRCDILCKMLFRFMEGVIEGHEKPGFVKEESPAYSVSQISHLTSE